MRILFAALLTAFSINLFAQTGKIDSGNYYNYLHNSTNGLKGSILHTAWLTKDEVTPILHDALKNRDLGWAYSSTIYKLENDQQILLAAYVDKANFGFLYIEGHFAQPQKSHRQHLTASYPPGVDYMQSYKTYSGKSEFAKITKLPPNIFVLNENCYWYQETDEQEDNKKLVTKEAAVSILKADIAHYLENSDLKTKFQYTGK